MLIICTPMYKNKADNRTGGVGYESHIISEEMYRKHNESKFIPILRNGTFDNVMPRFCAGKLGVDLSQNPYSEEEYKNLLATIWGEKRKPPVKKRSEIKNTVIHVENNAEPIHIIGIITNEVTIPRMDGTSGSALYKIPFQLSRTPSRLWIELFVASWNNPPSFTTMHRPGIARVIGSKIILNGTTIDEVKKYHRDTLVLCVNEANRKEEKILQDKKDKEAREQLREQEHYAYVSSMADEITFEQGKK